ARLASIPVPNPSPVVSRHMGTPSVAEAAAQLAAGGELLLPKWCFRGGDDKNVTIALARKETHP
ncbi:MAG: cobalamin biosynthesis protein, partial [Magnetococcales bacterium]|nr:cobalamin biosynthesis protein [Magnetococcales bacterium]